MNPVQLPQQQTEFAFRRLSELFDNWNLGFPVLFALTVLFIVACLRRERVGTLAWGLCFLIFVPMLMIGGVEARTNTNLGGLLAWLGCLGLGGLISGGFIVSLVRDATGWKHGAVWLCALPVVPTYIFLAVLDIKQPELKFAPIIFFFVIHAVVTVLRARLWPALIVVAVLSLPYLFFAFTFKPYLSWLVVLLPVLAVALFYVGMMYFKDATSIHPLWAAFLGLLRCTVYAILAFVFLLPGCQNYDPTEIIPKILVVFDVSGSMVDHSDDLPDPSKKGQPRLTRQDKVIEFWTTKLGRDKQERPSFLERVLEKSPATFYRFGPVVDQHTSAIPTFPMLTAENKNNLWTDKDWQRYLKPNRANIVMPEIVLSEEDLKKPLKEQKEERARRAKEQQEEQGRLEEMADTLVHGGTDVFGSVRDVLRAESGNHVQAIIVVSDGNSNLGSTEALYELQRRADNNARRINIYTVLVGNYREPTEIRNLVVQTAESARPDDRFPLKVFLSSTASLRDEQFEVYLEAVRKKDGSGKPLADEKPYVFPVKKGTFKGPGDHPQDTVDYEIDLVQVIINREANERPEFKTALLDFMRGRLASEPKPPPTAGLDPDDLKAEFIKLFGNGQWESAAIKLLLDYQKVDVSSTKIDDLKKKLLDTYGVGEWEFTAKVPRHPRETVTEAMHRSDPPTRVQVQNRELRVLLFAGGPTREYQFVRTLFEREVTEKRVEMSVFLQTGPRGEGVDQGVVADRLLTHFPNKLGLDDATDKFSSLNMYDVIICFDPDWTALDANQIKNLKQWVGQSAGGIIFVAGPVYSYNLARTHHEDFKPLQEIMPVILKDIRELKDGMQVDSSRPYALNFTPTARGFDFLKLDEAGESKTAGWERFFWPDGKPPEPGKDSQPPVRGMYNYYPVEALQPASIVLATFAGPRKTFMNEKDEMPYLVTMPVGNGKTVYIGSGETWRLRNYKESFHERFWIRLARFAASGGGQQIKYGRILVARKAQVGTIPIEAQIKGSDLKPLPEDSRVDVTVKKRGDLSWKPQSFELHARPIGKGEWQGWFNGKIKLSEPGEYEFSIDIPNTSESLSQRIVLEKPDREMADLREDPKAMWELATDAKYALVGLDNETKAKIVADLQPLAEEMKGGKSGQRLFFTLDKADNIPLSLLKTKPDRDRVKGSWQDLWDAGSTTYKIPQYLLGLIGLLVLGLAISAILFAYQRWILAILVLLATPAIALAIWATCWFLYGADWILTGSSAYTLPRYVLLLVAPFAVCALGCAIALFHRRWIFAAIALFLAVVLPAVVVGGCYFQFGSEWLQKPETMDFAFVMAAVISLLGIEWLTRKLLKLA